MKQDPKEGVNFVFEQNPSLANVGTEQDYSEYLKTIFPESKVKEIVYRGNINAKTGKFETRQFNPEVRCYQNGIYFSRNKKRAQDYSKGRKEGLDLSNSGVLTALIDTKSPLEVHHGYEIALIKDKELNELKNKNIDALTLLTQYQDEIVVFEPSQIHILGSQQDIEGFKEYVKHKNSGKSKQNNSSLEGKIISSVFILLFLAGLFLIPSNLTGNIIGKSIVAHKFLGIILTFLGICGFFIHRKLNK